MVCGSQKVVQAGFRRETTIGPADDVMDADGVSILNHGHAQARARDWLAAQLREAGGHEAVGDLTEGRFTAARRQSCRHAQSRIDAFVLPPAKRTATRNDTATPRTTKMPLGSGTAPATSRASAGAGPSRPCIETARSQFGARSPWLSRSLQTTGPIIPIRAQPFGPDAVSPIGRTCAGTGRRRPE